MRMPFSTPRPKELQCYEVPELCEMSSIFPGKPTGKEHGKLL